jgi:hypothetical protein
LRHAHARERQAAQEFNGGNRIALILRDEIGIRSSLLPFGDLIAPGLNPKTDSAVGTVPGPADSKIGLSRNTAAIRVSIFLIAITPLKGILRLGERFFKPTPSYLGRRGQTTFIFPKVSGT